MYKDHNCYIIFSYTNRTTNIMQLLHYCFAISKASSLQVHISTLYQSVHTSKTTSLRESAVTYYLLLEEYQ